MKVKLAIMIVTSMLILAFASFNWQIGTVLAIDAYNNDITHIEIWQYNGTSWNLKANFTSSGQSVRVVDGQAVKFIVGIKFSNALASSSSEAISFTRVYMNITDGGSIWNNKELNNTSCSLVGSFYYLKEQGIWNVTGYPQSGVTYSCTVLYQGYY